MSGVSTKYKMDKFPRIGGDGVTPDSLKVRVLPDNINNLTKPLLFDKSGYFPAEGTIFICDLWKITMNFILDIT